MRIHATALLLLSIFVGCTESPVKPSESTTTSVELRIDFVTPAVGSTTTPTTVVIRGAGFRPGVTVSVGGTPLQPLVATKVSLTVSVPPQERGAHAVVVTNPDGRSVRLENGFRFEPEVPTHPHAVRITGQLLAGDSDVPIAGATMRLLQDTDPTRPPITTDDDGRFNLVGIVPSEVKELQIVANRTGLGWAVQVPWILTVPRTSTDDVALRVPGLLLIRAGKTIRGAIVPGPDQIPCTFESIPCVPLIVDGPPGTTIDLELIPDNGQLAGLILTEEFLAPTVFPTRLTVSPRSMWIMGHFGAFTVKAYEGSAQR